MGKMGKQGPEMLNLGGSKTGVRGPRTPGSRSSVPVHQVNNSIKISFILLPS